MAIFSLPCEDVYRFGRQVPSNIKSAGGNRNDDLHQFSQLEKRKIDVLVGTRLKTCVHYSGGFVPWRSTVIIPQKGELQLITPILDYARLAEESFLDNVAGYGALPGMDFMDMIANRINELGCGEKTIGIESGMTNYLAEGFITLAEYEALKSRFPKANFVNATDIADRLTMIKEPEEIRLMRQATAIVDAAHEMVLQNLYVGITEKEIAFFLNGQPWKQDSLCQYQYCQAVGQYVFGDSQSGRPLSCNRQTRH